ncbi:MAG: hypothetical protein EBZ47_00725 [Chlamydiae bacterium]|nr:hypothetical protein [Chlamydiota bacterium]
MSYGTSFKMPFINATIQFPVSQDTLREMKAHSDKVRGNDTTRFNAMRTTLKKIVPLAAFILASILISPLWMPIANFISFLVGPVAWIGAGVLGVTVNDALKRIADEFNRQCPQLMDHATALAIDLQDKFTFSPLPDEV